VSLPRVLPVGDAALSVELADAPSPATNARVRALAGDLALRPFDGIREAVPTHRSLLVLYEPSAIGFEPLARELLARAVGLAVPDTRGRTHEIPTVYGGAHGVDLEAFAAARGMTPTQVARLHAGREYCVLMLGFLPGFGYLGPLPEALEAQRHATPRARVPAGSVALAGRQTGIYPVSSPGGWQLIGRTSLRLFDPLRERPTLFAPGDRVRFVPVPELPPAPPAATPAAAAGVASLEVLEPGLLTSVQDAGRGGWRHAGVGCAGPLDPLAHGAANRAVGNEPGAAALECTLAGPTLRFLAPTRFALAGADLGALLERADLGAWPVPLGAAVLARAGNVLRFGGRRHGCRATIAFCGGIDVPLVLGSRATDLPSGFGGLSGRALRARDRHALAAARRACEEQESRPAPCAQRVTARVVLGPQADHVAQESLAAFLSSPWRVGLTSDRGGCRLEGPRLRHAGPAEILSDGMVPGSIQLPPDGRPIVMLADGPTTGGYPKLACVVRADLRLLAQLVPGHGELRFEAVRLRDVQA